MAYTHYRFQTQLFDDRIGFAIWKKEDGVSKLAKPLEFEDYRQGDCIAGNEVAWLSNSEAQGMMDSLWSVGIRPTEGKGSAGAMSATQEHLKDMREIAFNKLNIKTT